jgi:hypothetical protein
LLGNSKQSPSNPQAGLLVDNCGPERTFLQLSPSGACQRLILPNITAQRLTPWLLVYSLSSLLPLATDGRDWQDWVKQVVNFASFEGALRDLDYLLSDVFPQLLSTTINFSVYYILDYRPIFFGNKTWTTLYKLEDRLNTSISIGKLRPEEHSPPFSSLLALDHSYWINFSPIWKRVFSMRHMI